MEERLRRVAAGSIGFMPEDEGLALHEAALAAPAGPPWVEIGSYCGKSAVYLGAAARARATILYSVDHHRGSEEHQPGERYYDRRLTDQTGRIDTLPEFKRTIERARLNDAVIPVVARSAELAATWAEPLGLVFIDGGHSSEAAVADLAGWTPHLVDGGLLAIHDVFEDPAEGGRPPFEIYRQALASKKFREVARAGSLRVLERIPP